MMETGKLISCGVLANSPAEGSIGRQPGNGHGSSKTQVPMSTISYRRQVTIHTPLDKGQCLNFHITRCSELFQLQSQIPVEYGNREVLSAFLALCEGAIETAPR